MVKLFEGAKKKFKYVLSSTLLGVVFWFLQFSYQYFFTENAIFEVALIRSFAFSGMTFISLALAIGPIFSIFPKYDFTDHRRTLGVLGFGFIILHILSVYQFVFGWNLSAAFPVFDPFLNPLIFGFWSSFIFFLLWITSTDWAVEKLSLKKWKKLHQLVYIAFIFSVLHFLLTNPPALQSLPGYLLLAVTGLAIILQLGGFALRLMKQKKLAPAIVGILIIIFGLVLFWLAFFAPK